MLLRMFLIIRNLFNHTEFSDTYAKFHCERHGFTANTRFSYKCYLIRYPTITVPITLAGFILIFSYIHRLVEQPFSRLLSEWDD